MSATASTAASHGDGPRGRRASGPPSPAGTIGWVVVSTVLVVIVLGVVIGTIARAVLEDEQPATGEAAPDRAAPDEPATDEVPAADRTPEAEPDEPPILVPIDDLRIDGRSAVPVELVEEVALVERARSIATLALLLVVVAAATAAALGVAIAAGAGVVDQALG